MILLLSAIVVTIALGRYAIIEGQRAERQKKFIKNMEEFDTKKNNESR